jgi:hypothetical protein
MMRVTVLTFISPCHYDSMTLGPIGIMIATVQLAMSMTRTVEGITR